MFFFLLLFPLILVSVPLGSHFVALATVHGLDPTFWPAGALTSNMLTGVPDSRMVGDVVEQFQAMGRGIHPAFTDGGHAAFWSIGAGTLYALVVWFVLLPTSRTNRKLDPDAQFGQARFATKKERARFDQGLEIGLDPETGRSVRVRVESNLLSIAPPRTGKTSAFIINNLLVPKGKAWDGSAVVIDPKGEVFEATQRRRKDFGRPVYCLDMRAKPLGTDRWNPLIGLDLDDVLYLQRAALALLPSMKPASRSRAVMRRYP